MTETWRPTATIERLRERAAIVHRLREFFCRLGFWEVETPLLSRDTVVDRHLEPIRVPAKSLEIDAALRAADVDELFLQTSPEFGMKRLVAAGADKIFQIGKAFRAGEYGKLHNPEFTMLEWYEVGVDYKAGRQRLAELANEFLGSTTCDQLTYRDAFVRFTGLDPFQIELDTLRRKTIARIDSHPAGANSQTSNIETWDFDSCLNTLWVITVEPHLGTQAPVIIYDWPASQCALAKVQVDGAGRTAERFELYCRGVELANGYHELTDASVFEERRRENNGLRLLDERRRLPQKSMLGQALEDGMPEAVGVALGVDRLIMVMTRSESIRNVIAFPVDRA